MLKTVEITVMMKKQALLIALASASTLGVVTASFAQEAPAANARYYSHNRPYHYYAPRRYYDYAPHRYYAPYGSGTEYAPSFGKAPEPSPTYVPGFGNIGAGAGPGEDWK
jgi:hypothetical protein